MKDNVKEVILTDSNMGNKGRVTETKTYTIIEQTFADGTTTVSRRNMGFGFFELLGLLTHAKGEVLGQVNNVFTPSEAKATRTVGPMMLKELARETIALLEGNDIHLHLREITDGTIVLQRDHTQEADGEAISAALKAHGWNYEYDEECTFEADEEEDEDEAEGDAMLREVWCFLRNGIPLLVHI
jgi:hypothetical protein